MNHDARNHEFKMVMKSYMHVQLAIVETRYYNLNANIKNQDYGLLLIQLHAATRPH